jgi:hypothetical protein
MKVLAQRKKNAELDNEIGEIQKTIAEKLQHNEHMSKRSNDLKSIIASKNGSRTVSQSKEVHSPYTSEVERGEL